MRKIIIAVDGASSCGKSTLAKALAAKLGYRFVDSGAMYRAVTLHFIRKEIDLKDQEAIAQALQLIEITFKNINGQNATFMNQEDVSAAIRTMEVSNLVSEVAAIPIVRRFAVQQQHAMGAEKALVMDGRDIGTVVFPDAELKLFISASIEVRTERRYQELLQRGMMITKEEVQENLKKRDHIDSTRSDSPLRKAKDAIGLDTTNLSPKAAVNIAYRLAQNLIYS